MHQYKLSGYLFTAPAVLLMVLILILPIAVAFFFSFTDYSLGNKSFNWVGVENYEKLIGKRSYNKMIYASVMYVIIVVPISIALGLGAALLINSIKYLGDFYKTIYFLPVMAALLAMAIVWEFTLHPTIGSINQSLSKLCGTSFEFFWWVKNGCAKSFPLWLGDKAYALPTICFIGIWQAFGFNMVLYLAGLTSVPRELYQAAEVDGAASSWSRFFLVTWPMLGPTTVFVVTITTIRSFQVFDTVEALTLGGPVKSTYVLMYAIFEKAIQQNLVGIGSAITVVFIIFVMFLTFFQRYAVEKRVHY